MRIGDDERRRRIARRHRLVPSERADSAVQVARDLVALHSSDPATVYLSAAVRMSAATLGSIDHELYESRVLLRHHAMRRTLWVMPLDVAPEAHAGFTRKIAAAERSRSATLFGRDLAWVDEAIDRVVAVVERAGGPVSTRDVAAAVPDLAEPIAINQGKRYEGTIAMHTRALLNAAFEARIVRGRPAGTWIGSQYAWHSHTAWTGWPDWSRELDEITGATAVVGRWLDRFGPGTLDDIVWWTGSTKGLIGRALAELGAVEVELDDNTTGYVLPDDTHDTHDTDVVGPWIALLPGLDPTPMGWKRRAWYLDPDVERRVTDRNGNIGPTVWFDGRVVGGWVQRPDGSIAHDAAGLPAVAHRLLDDEIERVRSFVGATRFSVRFPSPNQRTLLA